MKRTRPIVKELVKKMKSTKSVWVCVVAALTLAVYAADAKKPGGTRPAAVAGSFYPGDPAVLEETVDGLLNGATASRVESPVVALISPHAGYPYSGAVAAEAYAQIRGRGISRVVVISPCHVESFQGASVFDGDAYATPLGIVPVDEEFAERLAAASPLITRSGKGHRTNAQGRGEHALEIQLPFLQRALGEFKLVPVVMGDQRYETCRALGTGLASLINDHHTLIVASSDLSHFHPYDAAVQMDSKVVKAIKNRDFFCLSRNFASREWEACGGGPIVAAMMAAARLGANNAVILKYANSGDVARGDRERVVGYVSAVLVEEKGTSGAGPGAEEYNLKPEEKNRLLEIARASVEKSVRTGKAYDASPGTEKHPALLEERGAFVTLNKGGQLRGCIGYVFPIEPLCVTVRDVAMAAALRDRRFDPVSKDELADIEYEISVLSPLRLMTDPNEIQIGKHGLLVKKGSSEGLLLPQVAGTRAWDRVTFLEQTCWKAGLPPDTWKDGETDVYMFTALVFGEHAGN